MRLSHDDAVAGLELWNEELIDIGLKGAAVDRSVGDRAFGVDGLAQEIGVIGCIGHDRLGGPSLDQGGSLRRIALLTCGQREPHRPSQAANGHMDLGAQAAASGRTLDLQTLFFAPAAC